MFSRVKDYSKEIYKIITYFEIGKLLNEAGGKYGHNTIGIIVCKQYNKYIIKYCSDERIISREYELV